MQCYYVIVSHESAAKSLTFLYERDHIYLRPNSKVSSQLIDDDYKDTSHIRDSFCTIPIITLPVPINRYIMAFVLL